MSKQNPILVPASYDHEITIKYDSRTGQTELVSKKQLNELVMAGILAANASALINTLITQAAKQKGVIT